MRLGPRQCRSAEVDEADLVAADEQVPRIELPVDDAAVVEASNEPPDPPHERFVDNVDVHVGEHSAGAHEHEQGIVVGRRARCHDGVGANPGLCGQERQERLVLDLLVTPDAERRSGVPVPDGPPQRRQHGGVVGVAPVDLDDELLAVLAGGVDEEVPLLLSVGGTEPARAHTELGERGLDDVQAGTSSARSEREVHRGRGDGGDQELRRRRRAPTSPRGR